MYKRSGHVSKLDNIYITHTQKQPYSDVSIMVILWVLTHSNTTKNITTWSKNTKDAHHLKPHLEIWIKLTSTALQHPKTVNAGDCAISVQVWVGQNVYILLHINEFIKYQLLLFLCWIFLANLLLQISMWTLIYTHIYIHIHTYIHAHTHTHTHTHTNVCVCVCVHAHPQHNVTWFVKGHTWILFSHSFFHHNEQQDMVKISWEIFEKIQ